MTLAILTKFLNPADYLCLDEDLRIVDRFPIGHEQHPHRRWEYGMCLRAIREWIPSFSAMPRAVDVGGAGSSLRDVLYSISIPVRTIDPKVNCSLRRFRETHAALRAPIVISISTIEHVPFEEYAQFVEDLAGLVMAGGLLFLTADAWNSEETNGAHFNWMRERIYNPQTWMKLSGRFCALGFIPFGGVDWEYYGDHVYDYSFASLALVKEKEIT
jgi:hypothetical protein